MNFLHFRRKTVYYLTILFSMVLITSSCIKDTSPVITQTFDLETFTGVALSISGNVTIVEGTTQTVEVTGNENTVNEIKRTVENGVWDIRLPNNYRRSYDKLDIVITSDILEKLIISGSGNITGEDTLPLSTLTISGSGNIEVKTKTSVLNSTISGSGSIRISGEANHLKYIISGSGDIHGFDLKTDDADINISGSGNTRVHVSSQMDVNISGSGNVYYKGNPTISSVITGSGQIINSN